MISSYKNMLDLQRLYTTPKEKDIVWLEEEQQYYIWLQEQWQQYDEFAEQLKVIDTGISFYDLNKELVAQLPALSETALKEKALLIKEYAYNTMNTFYMLYGRELNYFTIFRHDTNNSESIEDIIIECLNNIGIVYSIELVNDNTAIEIWIKDVNNNISCLYFFPYDNGIVTYGD